MQLCKRTTIGLLLCTLSLGSLPVWAQDSATAGTLFPRQYKAGERYWYRLTTEQRYNGVWNSTSVVEMELTVMRDSAGRLYDEVRHISKLVYTPKDTTRMDAEAQSVKPYRISLHPQGSMAIPPIEVAGMTGPITDFITFFVAISPQSRVTTLQRMGDSLQRKELARGNFANGKTILVGDDCLSISAYIREVNHEVVKVQTRFMPPAVPCIPFLLDNMQEPVTVGVRNNFQMVQPVGGGKVNLQYGNEWFIINSTVRRKDGKLVAADMTNELQLSLRLNCDPTYQHCPTTVPFRIQRYLRLELVEVR
ncbi:hypothetical protein [Paraflavitalea pollutisoli]|uniref:hypothetical protein n=1 Tax=Paraflavitalea pollutisoli TaxID=3034143 RepID=UPI0023EC03D8|nr:hypothetical protein [Paraflavitalea sp. H1-2-19X]